MTQAFLPVLPPTIATLPPLKRPIFHYVLRQARERVRARENLRFERTRLFGCVRAILRELGHRLHADGVIESAHDVFYLEIGEILAAWEATGTTSNLGTLARQRRAEFTLYESTEAPTDRFQTRGPIHRHEQFETSRPPDTTASSLTGSGACPGRVTGHVRVFSIRAARDWNPAKSSSPARPTLAGSCFSPPQPDC